MKLSIIVPMYNAEKYIDTCVNTLVQQDIPNDEYEIIINSLKKRILFRDFVFQSSRCHLFDSYYYFI